MTRPFGMPETPKGRKGWKQNSNGKPNNWALNWSPSNSRLHNDPIQRGGVPWKPQAITLKTAVNERYGDFSPTERNGVLSLSPHGRTPKRMADLFALHFRRSEVCELWLAG